MQYSRHKTLDIYKDPSDYLKTSNTMTCIAEMVATEIQSLSIDKCHTEQKKDILCRNLAAQSHGKNKNTFTSVMISPDGLLQNNNMYMD